MRKCLLVSFLGLAVLLGARQSAEAATINFAGQPLGMEFSITSVIATADEFAGDSTSDTYLVTLVLNTTALYADSDHPYLQAVALDVGDAVQFAALQTPPSVGTWTIGSNVDIGLANGKCNGDPVPGSVCTTQDDPPALLLAANQQYTWVFKIDLGASGLNVVPALQFATAAVKNGKFENDPFVSAWLTDSGSVELQELAPAAVPEPASMLLLGSGLTGLAARLRRRRRS